MGTKLCCISPTGPEPKNTANTNVQRMSSSPVNTKMGTKQSSIIPTVIEPKNTAKTNFHNMFSSPVQSQQGSDALFPTGSHFQVSPKTDGEVKRPKPIGRHTAFHTFDNKKENASKDLDERSVGRKGISIFQTQCPRPGNEDPRIDNPVKAWTDDLSGSENKQVFDVPNRDHKKPSKRKKKNKSQPMEIRDADDNKTEESNENHAASSSNNMKTVHEYERNATRLESRVSQFSAEKNGLLNRDTDDIKTEESNENHAASSSNDMNIIHEYERNVNRLESRVSQLSAEKDGLLNRLSEIGAMKLTEHNPNVTDLGDSNRPQKVVEELSEIYDNEWTDAYECLTKKRKENTDQSVKGLLQILQEVFTICMSSTEKKTKALKKALVNYVGLTKEDQDELELKDIEKRIRDYRRKKLQNNFKRTEEEVGNQLKGVLTKETFDDVSEYIGSCVKICCKMCTKEPPMYLDFGDSIKPAQSRNKTATKMHFDKAKFMTYTKSGDYIDYVVWPAVYLFKDGPLMKKGVAQGIQEDEEYKDVSD